MFAVDAQRRTLKWFAEFCASHRQLALSLSMSRTFHCRAFPENDLGLVGSQMRPSALATELWGWSCGRSPRDRTVSFATRTTVPLSTAVETWRR